MLLQSLKQDPLVKKQLHCLCVAAVPNGDRVNADTHQVWTRSLSKHWFPGNIASMKESTTSVCIGQCENPLTEFLNNLSLLLKTFGVHSPEEQPVYPLSNEIACLNSMNTFLQTFVRGTKDFSDFQGQPSGPNGTMSSQRMPHIQRLIDALNELNDLLIEVNPTYLSTVDLHIYLCYSRRMPLLR